MSLPDPQHAAALHQPVIRPVFFAWLDFLGDPVRGNTAGEDITPQGTGDPDLDGRLFTGLRGDIVEISPVRNKAGGSETVTAQLSGIPGLDDDTLAMLGEPANWRGRDARLWRMVRNAANVQQGGYYAYYTGKMVGLKQAGSPDDGMTLTVTIENYLSVFSAASNRTYLDQEKFDPGDLSAKAAIAIANGNFTGASISGSYSAFDEAFGARGGTFNRFLRKV